MRMDASFSSRHYRGTTATLLVDSTRCSPSRPRDCEIGNMAKMTVTAWKSHRDANACQPNLESRGDKGPASSRGKTRGCAVPTPGRRDAMEALRYLAIWFHEQTLLKQTFWIAKIVDEIRSSVSEASAIAIQLGDTKEGHQEDVVVESREGSEEAQPQAPLPPQQTLAAQPLSLQPLVVFGEDEQEEVVLADTMV